MLKYVLQGGAPPRTLGTGHTDILIPFALPVLDLPPATGISEIEELRRQTPKRRGRPKKFDEPTITTTVRVTLKDHSWVLHNGLEFSAILRAKIHQLQQQQAEGPPDPKVHFVRIARTLGFTDAQIGNMLGDRRKDDPSASVVQGPV